MINRLYIYNFRSLESFALEPGNRSSMLLIGRNGSGKSTLLSVFEILQAIGRGRHRVGKLVTPSDFTWFRRDRVMRFQIYVQLERNYKYSLGLELPEGFKELRVADESLQVDDTTVFSRKAAEVRHFRKSGPVEFGIDWHQVALPIVQDPDPTRIEPFVEWLAGLVLLAPVPQRMDGETNSGTLHPDKDATNFANWFRELTSQYPECYLQILEFLRPMIADLESIQNRSTGVESKSLEFLFSVKDGAPYPQTFKGLSDGEKCFSLAALLVSSLSKQKHPVCFWDEPDNYIGLAVVDNLILNFRQAFAKYRGLFIATSHNESTINAFSEENVMLLSRHSHSEPTIARWGNSLHTYGSLAEAFVRGEDKDL